MTASLAPADQPARRMSADLSPMPNGLDDTGPDKAPLRASQPRTAHPKPDGATVSAQNCMDPSKTARNADER